MSTFMQSCFATVMSPEGGNRLGHNLQIQHYLTLSLSYLHNISLNDDCYVLVREFGLPENFDYVDFKYQKLGVVLKCLLVSRLRSEIR